MKKNFFYKVVRLAVDPIETTVADERHFPDVKSARTFARETPAGLRAFIFRMSADSVMIV